MSPGPVLVRLAGQPPPDPPLDAPTQLPSQVDVTVVDEPGVCTHQGSLCERLFDWTENEALSETTAWIVGTPLKVVFILGAAIVLNRLTRVAIRSITDRVSRAHVPTSLVSERAAHRTAERARSIGTLLRSAASAVIFGTATILVLDNVGISVVPLIASLGIVGIAIGFGAQSLVEDLIAGVMMVVEDQFGVGDRIDTGTVDGTVERLTLRSTVIVDARGLRWYLPNSEIRRVANESQGKSQARARIGLPYSVDLPFVVETLQAAAVEFASAERWQLAGAGEIPTPTVVELGAEAIVLEIRVFIESKERRAFESAIRVHLVSAAVAAGIELPSSELSVSMLSDGPTSS